MEDQITANHARRPAGLALRVRGEIESAKLRSLRFLANTFTRLSFACQRLCRSGHPANPVLPAQAPWHSLVSQLGSREAVYAFLTCGAIGNDVPRVSRLPRGPRLLVLAAHQDDELIGAGGTLLFCAAQGMRIQPVYFTDGATALGRMDRRKTSRIRYYEAIKVWRRAGGLTPIFMGFPTRVEYTPPEAGHQLLKIIDDFKPTTVLLPNFIEQPRDHRRLGEMLSMAHAERPLDDNVEVWAYQITTRIPGNVVVDITPVWRKKYALNKLWRSQNAYVDYAHLAMGRDIANSYFLKGTDYRRRAAHAELFLAFPVRQYLALAAHFFQLPAKPPDNCPPTGRNALPYFFIVGMQKSGTYWLTALLDCHPEIRCFPSRPGHADGTGEAHLFDGMALLEKDFARFRKSFGAKLGHFFADLVPKRAPSDVREIQRLQAQICERFSEYCHLQSLEHRKRIVGEKTTESVHHLPLLQRLYPQARKVVILRDPRDRVVSFHFHEIRKGRRDANARLDVGHIQKYIERVKQDYEGLLRIQPPFHVLTYEALTADPVATLQELLQFLDVSADAQVAQSMLEAASFSRLSGRSQGVEDITSHFRLGLVGGWTRCLSHEQAQSMVGELDELTTELERRFGLNFQSYRAPPAACNGDY